MRVLLTGGAGYIGSHTAISLAASGHEPVLLDNFANSRREVIPTITELAGQQLTCIEGDVGNTDHVRQILHEHEIGAVIHFAALKAVAESVAMPLTYHVNNVGGMLALLKAMDAENVRQIVFSSSATVYGDPQRLPIDETHPLRSVNPYGRTKLICEQILEDLTSSENGWRVSLLRYFNPVGAHPSGLIGEDPTGTPTNLMPLICRVARGQMPALPVFGTDYSTPDGSAVRDYIHVVDLAEGHVAALEALPTGDPLQVFNLGTGRGTSVLELIDAFEAATGTEVPWIKAPRRSGDVETCFASADRAAEVIGWRATRGIAEMCVDSWRFAARVMPVSGPL